MISSIIPVLLGLVEFEKGAIFAVEAAVVDDELGLVEFEKGAIFIDVN